MVSQKYFNSPKSMTEHSVSCIGITFVLESLIIWRWWLRLLQRQALYQVGWKTAVVTIGHIVLVPSSETIFRVLVSVCFCCSYFFFLLFLRKKKKSYSSELLFVSPKIDAGPGPLCPDASWLLSDGVISLPHSFGSSAIHSEGETGHSARLADAWPCHKLLWERTERSKWPECIVTSDAVRAVPLPWQKHLSDFSFSHNALIITWYNFLSMKLKVNYKHDATKR